jgi:hypothetical protein
MNNFLKVAYEQGKMAALQEAGLTKTALSMDDVMGATDTAQDKALQAYYGLKDMSYPVREALGISGTGDRISDRAKQLGAMLGLNSGMGSLKRAINPIIDEISDIPDNVRDNLINPVMDATRPDLFSRSYF